MEIGIMPDIEIEEETKTSSIASALIKNVIFNYAHILLL
jgi:hypothetical protein